MWCYPPPLRATKEISYIMIRNNCGNRIFLTNVGKIALCKLFSFQKGDQKPWNHRVKLVAPSVQPGCNPRPTIISLEVVAPTCIRTRCTWSCAIVRGTSFGGIHVARELRSRCAVDRTKKTVEHRLLHSLLFFTSRPQNSAKRISLKCIRYAHRGFSYLRWKLGCEKTNDFKSIEIREQRVHETDKTRSVKKMKGQLRCIVRKSKIQLLSQNKAVSEIFF